jgi:hypothetical protein
MKTTLTHADLRRIGQRLYAGVVVKGRAAWQTWLAEGLGVSPAAVRSWSTEGKSHVTPPAPIAELLLAAERVADHLRLWDCPRGTKIAGRMADAILASPVGKGPLAEVIPTKTNQRTP